MNKELIKNELQWLLEAINEQYGIIQQHGDKIPQIEFDILMENLRKFYEDMILLQRMNDPHFAYEKIIRSRITTKVPENEPAPKAVVQKAPAAEPAPPVRQTPPAVEVRLEQPAQFKPAGPAPVRTETASVSKKQTRSREMDLFAAEEPSFNIKLQDAREKTFSPKIPSERFQNLKSAISINDKFMFINELFDGNLREYNETIETLSGFKNLDQAADYLDLMLKKNFWDTSSNAFIKLSEMVERQHKP